jgi:hypothetical protein
MTLFYNLTALGAYMTFPLTNRLTAKLSLTSTVILGSESHGTDVHVLLSDGPGSLQDCDSSSSDLAGVLVI